MARSSTMVILGIIVLSLLFTASCSKNLGTPENQQAVQNADNTLQPEDPQSVPLQQENNQPNSPPSPQEQQQERQLARLSLPSCDAAPPLFNITPLQFSAFTHLIPLGLLDPPTIVFPSSRMHYVIRRSDPENYTSIPIAAPVVAPMDMVITKIKTEKSITDGGKTTDYTVYFATCRDIEFFVEHLTVLEQNLMEHVKEQDVTIPINAGERIGTAGGRENQFSLDLGVVDHTKPKLSYASPGRWEENPDTSYLGCPFTFFSEELQLNHTRAKNIGIGDGVGPVLEKPRTTEPLCGEIEQDEPGTAQGVWFKTLVDDTNEERQIALVHDFIDPRRGVFSIGTSFTDYNIPPGAYSFLPTQDTSDERTNVDFDLITADGNVYCYENLVDQQNNRLQNIILLVTMPKPTTLVIEKENKPSCGSKEWTIIKPGGFFER